jgi:hypothetical protein
MSSTPLKSARGAALALATLLGLFGLGCSTKEPPAADTAISLAPAPPMATTPAASSDTGSMVRGTVAALSDTDLTVSSTTGPVHVVITPPLHVFARVSSDLSHLTPSSFVGVTSVKQPDGSEKATEIHIFPAELRGLGEGSRPMAPSGGKASTMTNGSVSGSRMTNGSVAGSRMTNGTVGATASGTKITVQYAGGSQTIVVPPGVTVTAIAPATEKLAAGAKVIVLTSKGADGRLTTSRVMLAR